MNYTALSVITAILNLYYLWYKACHAISSTNANINDAPNDTLLLQASSSTG